nr:MAG TPA: hypothetical protein [Caudoviricetes sp.]
MSDISANLIARASALSALISHFIISSRLQNLSGLFVSWDDRHTSFTIFSGYHKLKRASFVNQASSIIS